MALAIHHWDSDGICSAAMLIKAIGEVRNLVPEIGEYFFDERIWDRIQGDSEVYVLDLNCPEEVEKVRGRKVFYYDHHLWRRAPKGGWIFWKNPVYEGSPPELYPSTTWLLYEELGLRTPLVPIGAIGDEGPKVLEGPRGKALKEILEESGISLQEARKIVRTLDSLSISLDREGVEEAARFLAEHEPLEVLEVPEWRRREEEVERRIEKALSWAEEIEINGRRIAKAAYLEEWLIASKVARKLVWNEGNDVALVFQFGKRKDYFYLRKSPQVSLNLSKISEKISEEAESCGGKRDVIGAVFPPGKLSELEEFIWKEVMKELRK